MGENAHTCYHAYAFVISLGKGVFVDWLRYDFRKGNLWKTRSADLSAKYNRKTSLKKLRDTPSI